MSGTPPKTRIISAGRNRFKSALREALPVLLLTLLLLPARCASESRKELPPCVVVDIDSTITDGRFQKRVSKKVPLSTAQDALRSIEEDGVRIIYLSKRFEWMRDNTVQWLATCGFPGGEEVILRENPKEKGYNFKLRELEKIQKKFRVLCGFGNPDDDKIYRRAGIKAIIRGVWQDKDWVEVQDNLNQILGEQ